MELSFLAGGGNLSVRTQAACSGLSAASLDGDLATVIGKLDLERSKKVKIVQRVSKLCICCVKTFTAENVPTVRGSSDVNGVG